MKNFVGLDVASLERDFGAFIFILRFVGLVSGLDLHPVLFVAHGDIAFFASVEVVLAGLALNALFPSESVLIVKLELISQLAEFELI
jgi:hypothetical protein